MALVIYLPQRKLELALNFLMFSKGVSTNYLLPALKLKRTNLKNSGDFRPWKRLSVNCTLKFLTWSFICKIMTEQGWEQKLMINQSLGSSHQNRDWGQPKESRWKNMPRLESRVPQGSLLGPPFFVIYVNDIMSMIMTSLEVSTQSSLQMIPIYMPRIMILSAYLQE